MEKKDIRLEVSTKINEVASSLTIFHRNVKILHWKYIGHDFISVHPWLDDVADQVNDMIDSIYEQMVKMDVEMYADYQSTLEHSKVFIVKSNNIIGFNNNDTFKILLENIDKLRIIIDQTATLAEEYKLFAFHELMVKLLSECDQLKYFVNQSLK